MQKCYDDAYLQCSTAVYFEAQNNEAEALRSWRQALDTIYYHNAYRIPPNYRPKSEVEKALHDSLRQMELQCKERVDLLEALKRSREEAEKDEDKEKDNGAKPPGFAPSTGYSSTAPKASTSAESKEWLGGGTVPPISYPDLSRPPPLPQRPNLTTRTSGTSGFPKSQSFLGDNLSPDPASSTKASSTAAQKAPRTPSPEKKKTGMLRTLRAGGREKESKRSSSQLANKFKPRQPAAANAASLAWGGVPQAPHSRSGLSQNAEGPPSSSGQRVSSSLSSAAAAASALREGPSKLSRPRKPSRSGSYEQEHWYDTGGGGDVPESRKSRDRPNLSPGLSTEDLLGSRPLSKASSNEEPRSRQTDGPSSSRLPKLDPDVLSYRKEYPSTHPHPLKFPAARQPTSPLSRRPQPSQNPGPIGRKDVPDAPSSSRRVPSDNTNHTSPRSRDDSATSAKAPRDTRRRRLSREIPEPASVNSTSPFDSEEGEEPSEDKAWQERVNRTLKSLPKGVDETAAKQILNEIVIQGDEVHWEDVAGLDVAKSALKETVVYPFLRPDLFMGLREPARGMLLFGPPGTGKTMLARAVATESRSTFFAISASSLTSKFLGESEKLVRALFALAKALAPSIIFVDEIDSLLSSRSGSGEHEATRRIKTEFLIQWSDLAKAAAGRETSEKDKDRGDASRVLVLAATNLPWDIDEAARRRFVRRQYIPLPEDHVRRQQLKTLLSHQKCNLSDRELNRLVRLTDGTYIISFNCAYTYTDTDPFYRILWLGHYSPGKRCCHGAIT